MSKNSEGLISTSDLKEDKKRVADSVETSFSFNRPCRRMCTTFSNESVFSEKTTESTESMSGIITSRLSSPVPLLRDNNSAISSRVRIRRESFQAVPEFAGCPDWVKPLMLYEYQVFGTYLFLSTMTGTSIKFCNETALTMTHQFVGWSLGSVASSNICEPTRRSSSGTPRRMARFYDRASYKHAHR